MSEDDTFDRLKNPPTEDETYFGRGKWIYCSQHFRPHLTGWCTVPNRNKKQLQANNEFSAYQECANLGLDLYR